MMPVSPPQYFEIKGQVYPLLVKFDTVAAGGTSKSIADASGYYIKIMGMVLQSNAAAAGSIDIYDDVAAGANLWFSFTTPVNTLPAQYFPICDTGYFTSTINKGVTIGATTNNQKCTLFYLQIANP